MNNGLIYISPTLEINSNFSTILSHSTKLSSHIFQVLVQFKLNPIKFTFFNKTYINRTNIQVDKPSLVNPVTCNSNKLNIVLATLFIQINNRIKRYGGSNVQNYPHHLVISLFYSRPPSPRNNGHGSSLLHDLT